MLDYPIQYMGVNAPREHQRIISRLILHLGNLFINGSINYEPLSETMLDEGKTSPTPDVILTDNVLEKDVLMIEITTTRGENDDFQKTKELVKKYNLEEGFTYNYKNGKWRKFKFGVGEITENPAFSEAIGYDLNEFVK